VRTPATQALCDWWEKNVVTVVTAALAADVVPSLVLVHLA
jgi:hypothetical protein